MNAEVLERLLLSHFPPLASIEGPAWAVGGVIRDLFLGVDPVDADVTCDDAESVAGRLAARYGSRVVRLGREDNLSAWRVTVAGRVFDFAPLTGGGIDADLRRRDFTVNAMAFDLRARELVDPCGGVADIEARIVRMIRPRNFDDDPLRMLRAVRLATRFRFSVDPETFDAIRSRTTALSGMAAERVHAEMLGILERPWRAHGMELLRTTGLDEIVFGERLSGEARAKLARACGSDPIVAWAILLDGWTDERLSEFCDRWRWSDEDRKALFKLRGLLKKLDGFEPEGASRLDLFLFDAGARASARAIQVLEAAGSERMAHAVSAEMRRGEQLFEAATFLDGNEIAALAGVSGAAIGRIKRHLLEAQLAGRVTDREEAERFVRELTNVEELKH